MKTLKSSYIMSEYKTDKVMTSSFKISTGLPYDPIEINIHTRACTCTVHQLVNGLTKSDMSIYYKRLLISN